MTEFEDMFSRWVVKNRWWIILFTIIIVLVSASGMRFLSFNMDNRVFFSEDNPQLVALEELENTYTKTYNVLYLIAPKDGKIFTKSTLAAIEELTEKAWQTPYSSRVDSITNYQHTRSEEDDLVVEPLVEFALEMSDAEIEEAKRVALNEPRLVKGLISEAADVSAVNINILLPGKSQTEVQEVAGFTKGLAAEIKNKYPGIDIHLTGGLMIDNAFGEVTADDMSSIIPLMFLTLIVIAGIALRSLTGTIGTVLVILFAMITGLGLAGWAGLDLNAASAHAPTIILTLALADSVHFLASFVHHLGKGLPKHESIIHALEENLQAIFLTSVTTAIGFLSMNFSDVPPFHDLGNIVATGVLFAFVYSVTFLPAMVAVMPIRAKKTGSYDCAIECQCDFDCSCNRMANFVIRHRRRLFWGIIGLTLIFAFGITRIELNDNFIKYFSEEYDIRIAADFMEERLSGGDLIEYSLNSGESEGINDPEYLNKVEDFANWFRSQPKVAHVGVITDTLKSLNRSMHGGGGDYYKIPGSRELAAQYLLLYEMSLPFGLDLNNKINVDKSATRMTIVLNGVTARDTRAIVESGDRWLKENARESMHANGSGLSVMWAYISERNINSMLIASFGALVLISMILIFALKSFKFGLISLVPNLAPAAMAFGLWGLIVGQVGLGLSVVVSMTLGIVVDDTIHFISKYLRARRYKKMVSAQSVRKAFNTVGRAMWITTISLVAGFMVLTLSGFKMNSDMGLMTAITISLALIMDFLLLPAILMRAERGENNG